MLFLMFGFGKVRLALSNFSKAGQLNKELKVLVVVLWEEEENFGVNI